MAVTQTNTHLPLLPTCDPARSSRGSVSSMSGTLPQLGRPPSTMATHISPVYGVYPAPLPRAADIPPRINPLRPEPPHRRTVSLQTREEHWQNDQRTQRMKQREHYRYHNTWSKYYYGSKADKEHHGAQIRATLKQQMADKANSEKTALTEKVRESEDAVKRDMLDRSQDALDFQNRYQYLTTFTKDNKRLMELSWDLRKHTKESEDRYDREQLRYNPINWSGTLK